MGSLGTLILVAGLAWIWPGAVAAHEEVTFELNPPRGDPVTLTAVLKTPRDHGPFANTALKKDELGFPAIVLLHGCAGVIPSSNVWAAKLEQWGYVVLLVDSFGPRGQKNLCAMGPAAPTDTRLLDAFAAKSYLAALPFVDATRIAVMGWSYGGSTAIDAVTGVAEAGQPDTDSFKAAVAFYPWCLETMPRLDAPLLILVGENDDWTPASRCREISLDDGIRNQPTLKVYAGATHAFDVMRPATLGQPDLHLEYDSTAADDAATQVEDFLRRHLQ